MNWRVFTGLLMLWIIIVILAGIMEDSYMDASHTSVFDTLLRPQIPAYTNPIGGISAIISVSGPYIVALFQAFTLDFPALFSGEYAILRFFLLTVFIGVMIYQILSGVRPA